MRKSRRVRRSLPPFSRFLCSFLIWFFHFIIIPQFFLLLSFPSQLKRNIQHDFVRSQIIYDWQKKVVANSIVTQSVDDLSENPYFNLLVWSSQNVVAIEADKKSNLPNDHEYTFSHSKSSSDAISDCNVNEAGTLLAAGTNEDTFETLDVSRVDNVVSKRKTQNQIDSVTWNENVVYSGSQVQIISGQSILTNHVGKQYFGYQDEICSLKLSPDKYFFDSGDLTGRINLWDMFRDNILQQYHSGIVPVWALAWSPSKYGRFATGDHCCTQFLNTWSGKCKQNVLTDVSVYNLEYLKNNQQLVTTHDEPGVSLRELPQMKVYREVNDHTTQFLYIAIPPCEQFIVTVAGGHKHSVRPISTNTNTSMALKV